MVCLQTRSNALASCSWSTRAQQKLRRNQGRLSEAAREVFAALEKAIDGGYALTWKLQCAIHVVCGRIVARLDRKCLGQEIVRESSRQHEAFSISRLEGSRWRLR